MPMKNITTLSNVKIGQILGISATAVFYHLSGKKTPRATLALKYKSEFGVPFQAWADIRGWLATQEAKSKAREEKKRAKATSKAKKEQAKQGVAEVSKRLKGAGK